MKIVFIGSVEFSQKVLAELLRVKTGITGVITRKNADFNSDFCDLSVICSQYNVPYIYAADVNAESTLRWVNKKGPDVIFNFGDRKSVV